jgi:TPR repeat protein
MYYEGRGVTQDYAEALKWFSRAADLDDSDGQ